MDIYKFPIFLVAQTVESACNMGDPGLIPGLGRFPREENGNLFLYSCLENPMDGGAWQVKSMGLQKVGHDWVTNTNNAMLSHFSRVRLCATPYTAAHQAPPPLGFSRQEHWSGLPFPSPMHESEKWKWSRSVVSDSLPPHGLQPTRLLRPWDFPSKSTGVGCHCLLRTLIIGSLML